MKIGPLEKHTTLHDIDPTRGTVHWRVRVSDNNGKYLFYLEWYFNDDDWFDSRWIFDNTGFNIDMDMLDEWEPIVNESYNKLKAKYNATL